MNSIFINKEFLEEVEKALKSLKKLEQNIPNLIKLDKHRSSKEKSTFIPFQFLLKNKILEKITELSKNKDFEKITSAQEDFLYNLLTVLFKNNKKNCFFLKKQFLKKSRFYPLLVRVDFTSKSEKKSYLQYQENTELLNDLSSLWRCLLDFLNRKKYSLSNDQILAIHQDLTEAFFSQVGYQHPELLMDALHSKLDYSQTKKKDFLSFFFEKTTIGNQDISILTSSWQKKFSIGYAGLERNSQLWEDFSVKKISKFSHGFFFGNRTFPLSKPIESAFSQATVDASSLIDKYVQFKRDQIMNLRDLGISLPTKLRGVKAIYVKPFLLELAEWQEFNDSTKPNALWNLGGWSTQMPHFLYTSEEIRERNLSLDCQDLTTFDLCAPKEKVVELMSDFLTPSSIEYIAATQSKGIVSIDYQQLVEMFNLFVQFFPG